MCRAMLELDAIRFATCQKPHGVSIYQRDLFHIQHEAVICCFGREESLQLWHMFHPDATTQGQDHACPVRRWLILQH